MSDDPNTELAARMSRMAAATMRPLGPGEKMTVPVLTTLGSGFVVKRPEGEFAPAQVGPNGGVSVGPAHLEGVGAVIHVALHLPDGETVIAIMGHAGYAAFATLMNEAAQRIEAGEFKRPETKQ